MMVIIIVIIIIIAVVVVVVVSFLRAFVNSQHKFSTPLLGWLKVLPDELN